MAKVTPKQSRDQDQDFVGLLNNLQEWEVSLTDKDKQGINVGTRTSERTLLNGKQTLKRGPSSDRSNAADKYNYLKEYESLSQLSSSNSQDSFDDANSEKELGNQFFKKQKFNEAIDCYSRSIALSPSAVAFANRAMAYIKIKRFQEAENDCTEALNLDDRYIKAYSRRATARKELGKLKEAIDDAEFALRLEPTNQELKKQFEQSKSLLEKEILKKMSGATAGSRNTSLQGKSKIEKNKILKKSSDPVSSMSSGRVTELEDTQTDNNPRAAALNTAVEIDRNNVRSRSDAGSSTENTKRKLADQKQILRASVQELAAKAANVAKAEAVKNIVPPTSAYQFELSWRGLSGDPYLQARLLKATSPSSLPGMFKNALTASLLVEIIRCISTFFVEDTELAIEYLQCLTQIPRFDMIIMCLSSADKNDVSKIWEQVFMSQCSAEYADRVSELRPRFRLKHC